MSSQNAYSTESSALSTESSALSTESSALSGPGGCARSPPDKRAATRPLTFPQAALPSRNGSASQRIERAGRPCRPVDLRGLRSLMYAGRATLRRSKRCMTKGWPCSRTLFA